jgi:hypothetical protein
MIADMLRRTDTKVLKVEFYDEALITAINSNFKGRRIDMQIEINGRTINLEVKNVFSHRWKALLDAGMKKETKAGAVATEAAEQTGQLYTDLLRYIKDGNAGRQYVFTPDVISLPDSVTTDAARAAHRTNPANIAAAEDEIIEYIKELVKKNENELAGEYNLNLKNDAHLEEWNDKVEELFEAMDGNGPDQQKFVRIFGYENIIKVTE